ncbi:MAG TPA: HAD family hydrolase, partial [Candidatus Saccharimonadales bacterium]|nr:HAD family hydrolase [Candidatus Saccharimonadales bacterium]
MSELFSSSPFALNMLKQAPKPTLCISDLDGTLFTPDVNILTAPLANYKLARFLKQKSIPFILATGRSDWGEMDKMQLSLLGISSPKVVITACGTIIYELLSNNLLARDVEWENHMHYTKVTWMDGKVETWNKLDILNVIQDYLHDHHFSYQVGKGNTFLIRLKVKHMPIKQLEEIRKDILSLFPKGLRVIFTEKLLWKNTEQVFSGDILIVPKNAGKENAVKYLLK